MEGGADTGFRHVAPEEYAPRLLHFSGQKRHITVKEVSSSQVTSFEMIESITQESWFNGYTDNYLKLDYIQS